MNFELPRSRRDSNYVLNMAYLLTSSSLEKTRDSSTTELKIFIGLKRAMLNDAATVNFQRYRISKLMIIPAGQVAHDSRCNA